MYAQVLAGKCMGEGDIYACVLEYGALCAQAPVHVFVRGALVARTSERFFMLI